MTDTNLYSINDYDSQQEYAFHTRNPHLKYNIESKPFPFTFYDDNGETFKAVPDFYDHINKVAIEYKADVLNRSETKDIARLTWNNFVSASPNRKIKIYHKHKYCWSNSIFKQAIVSRTVNSELCPYTFILIFKDDVPNYNRANGSIPLMKRESLNWAYESEYFH